MHTDHVYNIDESGLNFKMLPSKTLLAKHGNVTGKQLAKFRLTVATCSNASDNHKMSLFVTGKSKKPRPFKLLNVSEFPVYYRHKNSALMYSFLLNRVF